MDTAKEPLTNPDGKKEGVGFLVPSLLWLYEQLYPSYENWKNVVPQESRILVNPNGENKEEYSQLPVYF